MTPNSPLHAIDLQQGTLHEVLTNCAGASRPFSLFYPLNRHMPQRVRVLIDFLLERLEHVGQQAHRKSL